MAGARSFHKSAHTKHCKARSTGIKTEKIVERGGDYVLAPKGNQELTHKEIAGYLADCISGDMIEVEAAKTFEKNRGRSETRRCYKAPNLDWFASKGEWPGLKSAYAAQRRAVENGTTTEPASYYTSSLDAPPGRILELVRSHWKIEAMHWMLDAGFGEDSCRLLNPNGHQIMNILRKNAIAVHRNFIAALPQKTKPSVKKHMLRALVNDSGLSQLLAFDFCLPMK
jgi:predicted transposase YbfD/YdcC